MDSRDPNEGHDQAAAAGAAADPNQLVADTYVMSSDASFAVKTVGEHRDDSDASRV
jgi:hypothetical protein